MTAPPGARHRWWRGDPPAGPTTAAAAPGPACPAPPRHPSATGLGGAVTAWRPAAGRPVPGDPPPKQRPRLTSSSGSCMAPRVDRRDSRDGRELFRSFSCRALPRVATMVSEQGRQAITAPPQHYCRAMLREIPPQGNKSRGCPPRMRTATNGRKAINLPGFVVFCCLAIL